MPIAAAATAPGRSSGSMPTTRPHLRKECKLIAKKRDMRDGIHGEELLATVRGRIEVKPWWVLVLDNTDDLRLFSISQAVTEASSLYEFVLPSSAGAGPTTA